MESLSSETGVMKATCDQCQYGMEDLDGNPIKKPTTFLTNSPEIAAQLKKRCFGKLGSCSRGRGGTHRQCRGQVARLAAVYHFKLCRAILVGIRRQLDIYGNSRPGEVGMLGNHFEDDCVFEGRRTFVASCGNVLNIDIASSPYKDDLTGQPLDPTLFKKRVERNWSTSSRRACGVKRAWLIAVE